MEEYLEILPDYQRRYTDYIKEHRANIVKGLEWFEENLPEYLTPEIYGLVDNHDASKYSEEEFDPYAKYFYTDDERANKKDFEFAWLHHIHNNPHHWQHWVLINDEDGIRPLEIPKCYVIEMILDWWAFSWKKNKLDEIFSWYENNKAKGNFHINETSQEYIEEILDKMREKINA